MKACNSLFIRQASRAFITADSALYVKIKVLRDDIKERKNAEAANST